MKRFLREILIYSISFLLIAFLTSQLFSLEKRPYFETPDKIVDNNSKGFKPNVESYTLTQTFASTETYKGATNSTSLSNPQEVKQQEIRQPDEIIYEVRVGDTMIGIAQKYGVDWREIAKVNKLKDPNYLVVGQKLIIPLRSKGQ
ncbi:MAG: LysM peptidoglycan-binding domain-containing protein [Dictyoglomus thermophilum]|uniref:LysM peptidoglycan-binding domain-containing protein n=1 Tax=Dictyoglomus thermophilum TaxID=14 RepID=A0A7C2CR46_DICTH|nr:LysM domain-containing protein [Dictyoglomus thermophilum]MCX7721263.1 LysM peptidoglycan-binding domain-containing protein [Dictyoglomus thermophilum]TYT22863.1 LysM peptidoglycan-binding domain-containing protein [Dictyoglomus thermophilum]